MFSLNGGSNSTTLQTVIRPKKINYVTQLKTQIVRTLSCLHWQRTNVLRTFWKLSLVVITSIHSTYS